MKITTVLKPKTSEGSRPRNLEEHNDLENQTLDKYQFPNNASTGFYYRQYYQASNSFVPSKPTSRSSTRMEGTRVPTSQSTKNTSRVNADMLGSFLQTTEGASSQERAKTQQSSSLLRFFRRKDVRTPYSEISEEEGEKKSEAVNDRGLTETIKAVCYEKRRSDRNKFYLPTAPIYSKRAVYSKNPGVISNHPEDIDNVKSAQDKFIKRKFFEECDPYRVYFEDRNPTEERSSGSEKQFLTSLNQRSRKSEALVGKKDLFSPVSGFARTFKVNSIIQRSLRETPKGELLGNQIRSRFLEQKGLSRSQSEFKRYFLFVENLYLDEGKKSKLKYCYSAINLPTEVRTQRQIAAEFEQIKLNLGEHFNLNSKQLFLYLKNGTFVKNHLDVPATEVCLIVSSNQRFKGVYGLTADRNKKINMLSCLAHLEFLIREYSRLSPQPNIELRVYEDLIKKENRELYRNTLKVITNGDFMDSENLEKIYQEIRKGRRPANAETLAVFTKEENEDNDEKAKDYFDPKNRSKPLEISSDYKEFTAICRYYKSGTIPKKTEFDEEEEEDYDFENPAKLMSRANPEFFDSPCMIS